MEAHAVHGGYTMSLHFVIWQGGDSDLPDRWIIVLVYDKVLYIFTTYHFPVT